MAVKNPKCLVIDTSITKAAGGANALDPKSKKCRELLEELPKLRHSVIVTDDIDEQWNDHPSAKFKQWRSIMTQKGLIDRRRGDVKNEELREQIAQAVEPNAIAKVMDDMLLIEAALLVDKTICSDDDNMRGHLRRAARQVIELHPIVWVNPTDEVEQCILWLRQSAPDEPHRQLGYEQT